jgi:hypothetical protein
MTEFLHALDVMAGAGPIPPELEPIRPYIRAKKVAVLTDLPYYASGTDRTSGPSLSQHSIEVLHGFSSM